MDGIFAGKKAYGTGTFANFKKEELKATLEGLGCEFGTGYTKSLDYLIVGSVKGSSKVDKANADIAKGSKIQIIFEDEFMKMIGEK